MHAGPKRNPRTDRRPTIYWTLVLVLVIAISALLPRLGRTLAPSFVSRSMSSTSTPAGGGCPPPKSPPKPKGMSAASFREWNRLADSMDRFHSHFRWEYENIYKLADGSFHTKGMGLPGFLREAEQLSHHLDMHHRIEEAYIFPLLAKKMPAFKQGARENGEHIVAHRQIHEGLDKYDAYLAAARANPSSYPTEGLRGIMDSFHDVLFNHLDSEVEALGAKSMQENGFTLDELKRFPM